jgi:Family of unknown function (DUF5760)
METKEELVNNIKEWIKNDNEISRIQKELKEIRNNKKKITESLVNVMKNNGLDCFDINGGSLELKKSKVKKPINAKTLINTLKQYYKDDDRAVEITKFVMENREETLKETIKRKIDK